MAAAALSATTAARAAACDPRLPGCDPEATAAEVKHLVGVITRPIISRLP